MTLTPRAAAWASIAAPEPESRFVSSRILAPLVMACSAWDCCVVASPWAFWMSNGTPAALNAADSSGRSAVSQRTELSVSGSRTATFWAGLPDELELELVLVLEESSPPQAAMPAVAAQSAPARAMVLADRTCFMW